MRTSRLVIATMLAIALPSTVLKAQDGRDRRIVIFNNGSYAIKNIYASQSGIDNWQEDILGRRVLPAGSKITANLYDGSSSCIYDLKAIFRNGTTATRYRVNICRVYGWSIDDDENRLIE